MCNLFNDQRLPDYFWNKVTPEPNTGCWLWTGCFNRLGYGRIGYDGKSYKIHRLIYEKLIYMSPIPKNVHIHHKCEVKCCCNPTHLEFLTALQHARIPTHLAANRISFRKAINISNAKGKANWGPSLAIAVANSAIKTAKPVICSNGNTYKSMAEASRQLKINISCISECCNGYKPSTSGLKFMLLPTPTIPE
jgi:hypothetical protein